MQICAWRGDMCSGLLQHMYICTYIHYKKQRNRSPPLHPEYLQSSYVVFIAENRPGKEWGQRAFMDYSHTTIHNSMYPNLSISDVFQTNEPIDYTTVVCV